jgi:hypothetical protein
MKEERRRSISRASSALKRAETMLDNSRTAFAKELKEAVDTEGCSLGEVSKYLRECGRPITRQRVHQIINPKEEK